ncbi:MAG: ROK family protein [Cyclobacteriaceae bacterium]|nr:ROK family protein [Cyclobacteriaceae bacterium]
MPNRNKHLWGIDLGGTKIEGVVLESSTNPKVLSRYRMVTESQKGYQHVIDQIGKVIQKLSDDLQYRPKQIGMGTPGILDPVSQLMKNCNSTCLNGQPLQRDLEAKLNINFTLANDANCFALAETNLGVVKENFPDAKNVFGVIIGTGVGGGIVVNGKLLNGLHGIGGEWGHNYLHESGGQCYCGKVGCVETILSGPALEKFYFSLTNNKKTLPEIDKAHLEGTDKDASMTIGRLTGFFGQAMSTVVNILDPDVVVVGGGVGNIEAIYKNGVASLKKYVFNDHLKTHIVKPKLGDSAGVFGAAFLTVGNFPYGY